MQGVAGTHVPRDRIAQRVADLSAGRAVPAEPRDAATVMVLRQAAAGVEVLMLRRTAAMKFAPGAYVFPGGSVDAADFSAEIEWHGPDPAEFASLLGAPPELARALVCAAVRETFEESGILLAGLPDGTLAAPSGESWEADRAALTAGTLTLAQLLPGRGLVLRADLLVPWARWITPEAEPRRFDTCFFAAPLPAGQLATGHQAEADETAWLRPADALEASRAGTIALLPPTATTLNEFTQGGDLPDILRRRRIVEPIEPRVVVEEGEAWLLIPDEVAYPL
jgi:8-oxo-dGTP pyrophosphatase MutT (NUDIX family)